MIEQRLAHWTNEHTHTHTEYSSQWKVRWESVPIEYIKTNMLFCDSSGFSC